GQDLRVPAVAVGDAEKRGVVEPPEQLQADDLLVEPPHGVEIRHPQGDLAQALDPPRRLAHHDRSNPAEGYSRRPESSGTPWRRHRVDATWLTESRCPPRAPAHAKPIWPPRSSPRSPSYRQGEPRNGRATSGPRSRRATTGPSCKSSSTSGVVPYPA